MADPQDASPAPLDPRDQDLLGLHDDSWIEHARKASQPEPPLGMLGPYTLVAEIGRGGQGEVYKAIQPGTGRTVAIKRLANVGLADEMRRPGRFVREVDAVTRLSHPNIVTVYSAEMIDRHAVLVMEYIQGKRFGDWADAVWSTDRDALARVLNAMIGVCQGVAHAHQRGIIHRDLKPSNVIVDDSDTPHVLDFGVAALVGETPTARGLTATGFSGTPGYASPEQFQSPSHGVDTRSDIYSLGMLLYRVLSGREATLPSEGMATAIARSGSYPPSPSKARSGLPKECDWIVAKAADPDPARRYQTTRELEDDLLRLLQGHAVLAGQPSLRYKARRLVGRHPWTSGAVMVATLVVLLLTSATAIQSVRLKARGDELAQSLAAAQTARLAAEQASDAARADRDRADREAAAQRDLASMLTQSLFASVPDPGRMQPSRDTYALRTVAKLRAQINERTDRRVAAEIHMRYGHLLRGHGRLEESLAEIVRARDLFLEVGGPGDFSHASLTIQASILNRAMGRAENAVQVCEEFLALATAPSYLRSDVRGELAMAMADAGHPADEWTRVADTALAELDSMAEPIAKRAAARLCEEFATLAARVDRLHDAVRWSQQGLAITNQHLPGDSTEARIMMLAADALARSGCDDDAEPFAVRALAYWHSHARPSSMHAYSALVQLAGIRHRSGRFSEAADLWAQALIPLLSRDLTHVDIPPLRLKYAAALFGAGQTEAARAVVAGLLTERPLGDANGPTVRETVATVEAALRTGNWQFDDALPGRLKTLRWIVEPTGSGLSHD